MYAFNLIHATSVQDALRALNDSDDGLLLAGGQTLIPTLKQRLTSAGDIIDLSGIGELSGIDSESGAVVVGAMTRHDAVANSATVKDRISALADLAESIGDPQVRNMGTIGGSIANNDPAADYPAALVGLGATVNILAADGNSRSIGSDDFFTGMFETALNEGEIITSVSFPVPDRAAYVKFPNPASRYAVVGVFVSQTGSSVRLAVTGAGASVFRVGEMERALEQSFSASSIDGIEVSADDLNEDIHASAEYRAHLVSVMAMRAVAAA